jgi:hypothetical protein
LLQGVGAGAQAYEGVQNQMLQRAKEEAEISAAQLGTARAAFTPIPGQGPVIMVVDPKTGTTIPMQQKEFLRRTAAGEKLQQVGLSSQAPTGNISAVQPTMMQSKPTTINGVIFDPKTAENESLSGANYDDMLKQSAGYINSTRLGAEAARNSRFNTIEAYSTLANAISSGDRNALSEPGALAAQRSELANLANTFGRMFGFDNIAGPGDTNAAILAKLNNAMAGQQVSDVDERSLQALRMALSAQPGTAMPPESAAELSSQSLVRNQRFIDKQTHLSNYTSSSPNGTAYGAGQDFDNTNGQNKYNQEQQAFKRIMLNQNGAKAISIMKEGGVKPELIEQYLYNNTGIHGLSRYFTSGG